MLYFNVFKEMYLSNLRQVKKVPVNNTLLFERSTIYTQCGNEILEGDKVFVDTTGIYHKDTKTIEILMLDESNLDIGMYHFGCIVDDPDDVKKEKGIYFERMCSKCVHKDLTYDGKPCNLCKFNEFTIDRTRAKDFYERR